MFEDYVLKAKKIATSCADSLNLVIEEVSFVSESGTYILRIIASKEDGVFDIDDCTRLNEAISERLDIEDFIKEEYMLEVSSAGCEKQLKSESEIIKNISSYVHIDLYSPYEIMKNIRLHDIEGELASVNEDSLDLNVNLKGRIKKVNILKSNIKLIRKAIKF